MRKLIASLLAAGLLLAACGDSTESTTADPSTTQAAGGDDTASTTAAPTTAAPTTQVMAGDSDWCEGSRAIDALSDQIEAESDGIVEQISRQFQELAPMQIDLARHAPDEIADDVSVFIDKMSTLRDVLEEYDYNLFDIPEDQMALLDDPALGEASDAIQAYNEANCGITDDDDVDDGSISAADVEAILGSERRMELLAPLMSMGLSEDQAECAVRAAASEGLDAAPTDPQFAALLGDCGLSVEDLARLGATGSIDGDIDDASIPELGELIALLPMLQGNPELGSLVVDTLVTMGIDEVGAGCVGDALTADDSVDTYTDASSILSLLDDCGIDAAQLAALAG